MSQHYINFKRERSFGDKINATFAFVSQNLKPIAKSALYIAGPFALFTTLALQAYQLNSLGGIQPFTGNMPAGAAAMFQSSAWLAYLVVTYLILFAMTALTIALAQRHIKAYVETGSAVLDISQLAKTIWRDCLSVLGTTIGIVVLMFIAMIVMIIPFSMLMAGLNAFAIGLLMMVAMSVGSLLIGSLLMLIYPIKNFEKINFFDAIGRALTLNKGKWWSSAGLVLVTFIIQFVIVLSLSIPVYAIMFYQVLHTGSIDEAVVQSGQFGWQTIFSALASIIYSVGITLIGSIMLVALTFQYFNLRERREASGLLERMQTFGVAQAAHEEEEQY